MLRLLLVGLIAILSGCEGSVLIDHFVDPRGEGCEVALTQGTLDLAFSREYVATIVATNVGHGEATITEAEIRVWFGGRPEGDAFYFYSVPMSTRIIGGFDANIDLVVFSELVQESVILSRFVDFDSVDRIPVEELMEYRDLVTIQVNFIGDDVGEDAETFFNLGLCYGCLVTCPPASTGASGELCESTTAPPWEPERLGQDEEIDCRLCVADYDAGFCRELCQDP